MLSEGDGEVISVAGPSIADYFQTFRVPPAGFGLYAQKLGWDAPVLAELRYRLLRILLINQLFQQSAISIIFSPCLKRLWVALLGIDTGAGKSFFQYQAPI